MDDDSFDRMWVLSKRAKGANVGLRKYLKKCIATGREPWQRGKRRKPMNGEPRTPNKEPGNLEP